jgi:hypothetical protein
MRKKKRQEGKYGVKGGGGGPKVLLEPESRIFHFAEDIPQMEGLAKETKLQPGKDKGITRTEYCELPVIKKLNYPL